MLCFLPVRCVCIVDSPMIVNVGPSVNQQLTVTLYESTRLECHAEGNPAPRYQWLHRRSKDGEEEIVIRSEDRYLHITNVTYEHQVLCHPFSHTRRSSRHFVVNKQYSVLILYV